jgi:hypothetical protein
MPKTRFLKLPVQAAILKVALTRDAEGDALIGTVDSRQVGDSLPIKRNKGIKIKGIFRITTPPTFSRASEMKKVSRRRASSWIMVFRLAG